MNFILMLESMQLFHLGLLENKKTCVIFYKFSRVIFYNFLKFLHKGRTDINKAFVDIWFDISCLSVHALPSPLVNFSLKSHFVFAS